MAGTRSTFKTAKNTELPLLNLKGKEYLQVAHRLVWFRETHPNGLIRTTMLANQGQGPDEFAVFKAEIILDTEKGPMLIATGHKRESRKDFPDFMEKCETGSIGRALALAGFGTQFTGDELNEGDRLADAPVEVITTGSYGVVTGNATDATTTSNGTTTGSRKPSFRKNISVAASTGDDI